MPLNKWTAGRWVKGKRTITGHWKYNWASDTFSVEINKRDSITGESIRNFLVYGDTPEWNGWKLQEEVRQ